MVNKKFYWIPAIALVLGIVLASCSEPGDNSVKTVVVPELPRGLTINSDGIGAVDTLITSGEAGYETASLTIRQIIPDFQGSSSSTSVLAARNTGRAVDEPVIFSRSADDTKVWPANSPIIVFFDDIIYLGSIEDNFEIWVGSGDRKERVYGTVVISSSTEVGKLRAILTFMPYDPFEIDKGVTINIRKGLKDKCGNGMVKDTIIGFTAKRPTAEGSFTAGNWGFEAGMSGVEITGDGAIFEGNGTLVPHGGEKLAAISSGNSYYDSVTKKYVSILSDTPSIENKSSLLKLGPIDTRFSKISLWYDFISAEFNDWVNTIYNDEAVITIYGPNGTVSKNITSVNTIGPLSTNYTGTLKMPDAGDTVAGQTGWTEFVLDDINVGFPAYIIFTVSDIGDTIYSSILAVDDIVLSDK